jgi:hypothetical protein
MVEHDCRVRERSREADGVGDLGVRAPDLEAELAGTEVLEASAKVVAQKQALGRVGAVVLEGLACQKAPRLIPRNRPPPAAMCASRTSPTASPIRRSTVPMIPAAIRVLP